MQLGDEATSYTACPRRWLVALPQARDRDNFTLVPMPGIFNVCTVQGICAIHISAFVVHTVAPFGKLKRFKFKWLAKTTPKVQARHSDSRIKTRSLAENSAALAVPWPLISLYRSGTNFSPTHEDARRAGMTKTAEAVVLWFPMRLSHRVR
jgi:hypothetical protein